MPKQTLKIYMESLISLVQENYVDHDRTSLEKILIQTLEEIPRHKNFEQFTVTKTSLKIDSQEINISLHPISKDDLANTLTKIAQFICEVKKYCNGPAENIVATSVIAALDPHSAILTAAGYNELKQSTEGMFAGLGVVVSMKNYILEVTKTISRSPAEKAGVKAADQIIKIDGKIIFGTTIDQVVEKMRGSPDTQATLTIRRKGLKKLIDIVINREWIDVASVTANIKKTQNGAYFVAAIESFSAHTSDELLNAYKLAVKKAPLKGFILDLRSNPGGLLDQAVAVADLFLAQGDIVSTDGQYKEVEMATGMQAVRLPLAVLVNSESASASEIVAGALRDHHRGIIIGQKTFGKGSVQTLFDLPFDTALKLTIARYFTPSKQSIQNLGVTPDVALHPLTIASSNKNLFGRNHFVTEASLSHHLQNFQELNANVPSYSFAYLKDDKIDEDEKVAEMILNEVPNNRISEQNLRSSYWLERARESLESYGKLNETKVGAWLKNAFKIQWTRPALVRDNTQDKEMDSDIGLKVLSSASTSQFTGAKIELHWEVTNPTAQLREKLAVYLDFEPFEIEPQEIVVGSLAANEKARGKFEFNLPKMSSSSQIEARIRVVDNFELLEENLAKFTFKLKSLPQVQISLQEFLPLQEKKLSAKNHALVFTQNGLLKESEFTFTLVDFLNPDISDSYAEQKQSWKYTNDKLEVQFPASVDRKNSVYGLVVKSDSLSEDKFFQVDFGQKVLSVSH